MDAASKSTKTRRRRPDAETNRPCANVGLCATCTHARRVKSERGSEFWLCQLSATDPRLAKYPRLPMLECPGYMPGENRDRTVPGPAS